MKKYLAFLLALLMALSLVSCGAGEKETDGEPATPPEADGSDISMDDTQGETDASDGKSDPPPEADGSEPTQTDDKTGDETENDETVTSVTHKGDWMYLDLFDFEAPAGSILVIDDKEELKPYLQTMKEWFASDLKGMAQAGGERVTYRWLEAVLRLRGTIDTFEQDGYFRGRKLLLMKIDTAYNPTVREITDVVLIEKEEERKLQINVTVKGHGFGVDAPSYSTFWVYVPENLDIDYEKDIEVNVTY